MDWDPHILNQLLDGDNLSLGQVSAAFDAMMSGAWSEAQVGAFLAGLRSKGETMEEIAGAARSLRHFMEGLDGAEDAIDIVGTGGDGSGSINISTATSFVVRGAGVKVAKHGNRSVSSRCGSADVLEALGARVDLNATQAQSVFDMTGYTFMFAPSHHPAMKHVVPVRRSLGVRTIFNILGPLANPARVERYVLGVYDAALVEPMAYVLKFLGAERALVVHGDPGLDEVSLCGANHVAELIDGEIHTAQLTASDFGAPFGSIEDIAGGDAEENAASIRAILAGEAHSATDAILANAGAALYVAGEVQDLSDGYEAAQTSITSGHALQVLETYVAASQNA